MSCNDPMASPSKFGGRNSTRVGRLLTTDDTDTARSSDGGGSDDVLDQENCPAEAGGDNPSSAGPTSSSIPPSSSSAFVSTPTEGSGGRLPGGRPMKQRILVVANRLPLSAVREKDDSWSLSISAGGLVSALSGVKEVDAKWIGWAGVIVPDEKGRRSLTLALAEKRCVPVFLDEEVVQLYYNGYCNTILILWPLFHYLGLPQEDRLSATRSFQSQLDAYKRVNRMFADAVNEHYQEGDVVWCQDYHLMFLPECLKELAA